MYSTLKFSGGRVVVGLPPPARVQALGRDAWVPLAEILNADHESPYYSQTGMAGILYNEGWALVHMLAFHPRYALAFPKLLEAIEQGTRSRDALERIYGKPLASIERELKSYLGHGLFASRTIQTKLPPGGAAAFEPAAMYDVRLALLDLASRVGNAADTRAGLVSLVREDPRRPEPHVALGYLLVRSFHEEDAFRSFQTAVNLGSRDPQMLWDYGRLAAAKLPEQAMSALRLLLADQPARSDARLELAEILMSRRRPREALEILAPVTTVVPESTAKLNEVLAMANLEVGNRDQALEHARHWLAAEHDASRRLNANRIVRYLDETSRAE